MSCQECEQAIYTQREISATEKEKMEMHIQTCEVCQKLFSEVKYLDAIVKQVAQVNQQPSNAEWLTNKIMTGIITPPQKSTSVFNFLPAFFSDFIRYSFAGISACLLLFFFAETGLPSHEFKLVKGPIANLQGTIINSQELRKHFTNRREKKKQLLADCTTPLQTQIDLACLRGKIKRHNF